MNVLDTYENGEKTEVQVFLLSLSLSLGCFFTYPTLKIFQLIILQESWYSEIPGNVFVPHVLKRFDLNICRHAIFNGEYEKM